MGIFSPTESFVADGTEQDQHTISLSKIVLPQQQPRRYFDPDRMAQLTQSVQEHGILEPLLVRVLGSGKYELVAGERRFRAAKAAQLAQVPVLVRDLSDEAALQISLVENLQREDLNPVEETEGIINLLAMKLQLSQAEIPALLHRLARASDNVVGKNRGRSKTSDNVVGTSEIDQIKIIEEVFNVVGRFSWESFATHRLPLLNLPESILNALHSGQIEYTKARMIARVKDSIQRDELLEKAIANNLSFAQIKQHIAALKSEMPNQNNSQSLTREIEDVLRLVKRSNWADPKKQKRLKKLLGELRLLAADGS